MDENIGKPTNFPLVSVLLPVYNGEKYVSDTIKSILKQTYTNIELIIINDCSTDYSEEIILSFNDKRIRYYKNVSNLKLIQTLNKGLVLSKGKYIVRIDADDIAHPDRIQIQVDFLEKNPEYILVGSKVQLLKNDKLVDEFIDYFEEDLDIKFAMTIYCPFIHPSVIIRKSVLVEYQIEYDSSFLHAEDYVLWIKLSKYGKFHNLNQVLLTYRIHDEQISSKFLDFQLKQMRKIQIDYISENFPFLEKKEIDFIFFSEGICDLNIIISKLERIFSSKSLNSNAKKRFVSKKYKNLVLDNKNRVNLINLIKILFNNHIFSCRFTIKQKISLIRK